MKPTLLISTFLFTSTVWADPKIFYSIDNARLGGMTYLDLPKGSLLALHSSSLQHAATFDLDDEGVVTVKVGNTTKVMGVSESNIVIIGDYADVTPFKVQLDKDSKVSNLHPYVCKCAHHEYRGVLMSQRSIHRHIKCTPSDIYLISPGKPKPEYPKKSALYTFFHDFWKGVKEEFRSPKPISELEFAAKYGHI